jgi:hypothetical protein
MIAALPSPQLARVARVTLPHPRMRRAGTGGIPKRVHIVPRGRRSLSVGLHQSSHHLLRCSIAKCVRQRLAAGLLASRKLAHAGCMCGDQQLHR